MLYDRMIPPPEGWSHEDWRAAVAQHEDGPVYSTASTSAHNGHMHTHTQGAKAGCVSDAEGTSV